MLHFSLYYRKVENWYSVYVVTVDSYIINHLTFFKLLHCNTGMVFVFMDASYD